MTYIPIFGFTMYGSATSGVVEFNDLKSCQAAAVEIKAQAGKYSNHPGVLVCAAKGQKGGA